MSLGIRRLLLAFFFASSTIASPVPQLSPKLLFPRFSNTSTTSSDTRILTPQSVNTPNAIQSVHAADTGIPFVVPVNLITSDGSIIQETSTPPVTPSSTPHPLTGTFSSASTPAAFSQTPKYNLSTPNPGLSGGFQGAETSADLIPTTTPAQNSSSNVPATRSTETLSRPSTPSNQFTYDPLPGTKTTTSNNATSPARLSLGPSTPTSLPSTPTLTPIRTPNQVSTPLAANATFDLKDKLCHSHGTFHTSCTNAKWAGQLDSHWHAGTSVAIWYSLCDYNSTSCAVVSGNFAQDNNYSHYRDTGTNHIVFSGARIRGSFLDALLILNYVAISTIVSTECRIKPISVAPNRRHHVPHASASQQHHAGADGITIIPVDPSISTYTETTTHIKTVTVKETETTTLRETVTARETVTIQETDAPRVTVTAYDTLMMKLGE
ncbi:uncharacterized protein IWZ02DRAFT_494909 [Phyllosticta citriasiana]|uniref:uncharacterized protein n=1 Tax=Phyllosticta citriasiana TaxID=595635 RepID=UPI0030FD4EB4